MQLLPQKKESYVPSIIVGLILTALAVIFLDLPAYSKYNQNGQALQAAEDQANNADNTQKQVASLIDKINTEKDKLTDLDLAIPTDSNIPDLYAHLETLAKSSNLTIDTIQATDITAPESKKTGTPDDAGIVGLVPAAGGSAAGSPQVAASDSLGVIVINLGLKGDIQGFEQFLSSAARSLRIIDVQSIDVSLNKDKVTPGATSQGGAMSFQLVLKTYYQK